MAKKVVAVTSETCPHCTRAKKFLKDNGIEFENVDVSTDRERAMEIVAKSGQMGVPVLEIDGEIIVGFDEGRIRNALGI